jgi:hypothetical protein
MLLIKFCFGANHYQTSYLELQPMFNMINASQVLVRTREGMTDAIPFIANHANGNVNSYSTDSAGKFE